MIRINKPLVGPRILSNANSRGPKKTEDMMAAFDAGQRDFEFISDIYGAKSVKNAWIKAQHDKCCFCESKIRHISHGDVEHFRPKAGWVQKDTDHLTKPGYYWLAYAWSNLFLSCQICNQRHKKNLFPLTNPSSRARSHHPTTSDEDPLFLNPAQDDPETHIGFRAEVPFAIGGSQRGERTIEALGLRRQELTDRRRDYLEQTLLLAQALQVWHDREAGRGLPLTDAERALMAEVSRHLNSLLADDKQYASMIRHALKEFLP